MINLIIFSNNTVSHVNATLLLPKLFNQSLKRNFKRDLLFRKLHDYCHPMAFERDTED